MDKIEQITQKVDAFIAKYPSLFMYGTYIVVYCREALEIPTFSRFFSMLLPAFFVLFLANFKQLRRLNARMELRLY
jgi:hypothetical protein